MENEVGYENEDTTEPIHNDKEILLYVPPADYFLYRIVLIDQKYTRHTRKVFKFKIQIDLDLNTLQHNGLNFS